MSEPLFLSDDQQSRKEDAFKAAMPYILDGRRDAYGMARDDGAVDAYSVIRDALSKLWGRLQASLYPMPKAVDPDVPAEPDD